MIDCTFDGDVNWIFATGGTPLVPVLGMSVTNRPGSEPSRFDNGLVIPCAEGTIHLLDERTGVPVPGSPADLGAPLTGTVAIGDIDLDGNPEMVIAAENGTIHLLNGTLASSVNWPIVLSSGISEAPFDPGSGSAGIGDFDDDGEMEIVVVTTHSSLYLFDPIGRVEPGFPVPAAGASPYGVFLGRYAAGDTTFLFTASEKGRFDVVLQGVSSNPPIEWRGFQNGNGFPGRYLPAVEGSGGDGGSLLDDAETFVYPNQSRAGRAIVHYRVRRRSTVTVRFYDVAGNLVGEAGPIDAPPESAEVVWDTSSLASGVYFARIEAASAGRSDHRFLTLAVER